MELKNYLIGFFLFSFTLCATNNNAKITPDPSINIEILNIVTNGLILPNNTISFNDVENLEIEFEVKTTYTGIKNNNPDIFKRYFYKVNTLHEEPTQYYNNGITPFSLFQKLIVFNTEKNYYTETYTQKLNFKRSTLYNTGNTIVFKRRTASPKIDVLNKITYNIIGGTKTKRKQSTLAGNIGLAIVSYSDGSPILNNTIIVPDFERGEIGTKEIDLSFDLSGTFASKLAGYHEGIQIQVVDEISAKPLTKHITPIVTNGILTLKKLKIKASDLSPTSYLNILFSFQGVEISLNCAKARTSTVKPLTDTNTFSTENLTIFPNPVINSLYINGAININDVAIYDSFGQKINLDKHQKSDNLIEVNTWSLQSGIYFLKVDDSTFSKTLIKN